MRAAIRVESWKLARSRVPLVTTALLAFVLPALGLGLYSVARNGGVGALADKATAFLVGEGWVGYAGVVDQVAAVAVFLAAGVVVSWAFGREHSDRTFPSLFALPVSRGTIAAAKFVVLAAWVVSLAVAVSVVTLALGVVGNVGTLQGSIVTSEMLRLFMISIGAGILSLTMGLAASLGRGYLPAIGALILIIAAAQVSVLFGTGGWFPFAVPGLMAVAGAEGVPDLNLVQLALVPGIAALCIWLTVIWWRNSEVV